MTSPLWSRHRRIRTVWLDIASITFIAFIAYIALWSGHRRVFPLWPFRTDLYVFRVKPESAELDGDLVGHSSGFAAYPARCRGADLHLRRENVYPARLVIEFTRIEPEPSTM